MRNACKEGKAHFIEKYKRYYKPHNKKIKTVLKKLFRRNSRCFEIIKSIYMVDLG